MKKYLSVVEASANAGEKRRFVPPVKTRRPRPHKFQVNHPMTSGGPTFSSLSEALRYIAHAIQNGNDSMSIRNV